MSENEDGIPLIPETEARVCACRTGSTAVASLFLVALRVVMRMMGDGEWELPVVSHLFGLGGIRGSSVLLRACRLSHTHLLVV